MRVGNRGAIFLSVTRGTAQLRLAIDIDSDPISGWISNRCGLLRSFHGWLELTSAIEAARVADPSLGELGKTPAERLGSIPGTKA